MGSRGATAQLLTNQSVPDRYLDRLRERLEAEARFARSTRDRGGLPRAPTEVLAAADVRLDPRLDAAGVADTLRTARARIGHDVPAVARLYLTPVD